MCQDASEIYIIKPLFPISMKTKQAREMFFNVLQKNAVIHPIFVYNCLHFAKVAKYARSGVHGCNLPVYVWKAISGI